MNFRPTTAQFKKDAKCLNRVLFSNSLNFKNLILEIDTDLRAEWGYCVPEGDSIILGIASEFPDEYVYQETLKHELIHVFQIQKLHCEPNHGSTFHKKAKEIGLDNTVL